MVCVLVIHLAYSSTFGYYGSLIVVVWNHLCGSPGVCSVSTLYTLQARRILCFPESKIVSRIPEIYIKNLIHFSLKFRKIDRENRELNLKS